MQEKNGACSPVKSTQIPRTRPPTAPPHLQPFGLSVVFAFLWVPFLSTFSGSRQRKKSKSQPIRPRADHGETVFVTKTAKRNGPKTRNEHATRNGSTSSRLRHDSSSSFRVALCSRSVVFAPLRSAHASREHTAPRIALVPLLSLRFLSDDDTPSHRLRTVIPKGSKRAQRASFMAPGRLPAGGRAVARWSPRGVDRREATLTIGPRYFGVRLEHRFSGQAPGSTCRAGEGWWCGLVPRPLEP